MASPEGSDAAPYAALVWCTDAHGKGPSILTLTHDVPNTLGRSAARAKLVVESPKFPNMISRLHATIEREGGEWTLKDHKTLNGTTVDGRIVRSAVLKNGSRVSLGGAVGRQEGEPLAAPATDVSFRFFTDVREALAAASALVQASAEGNVRTSTVEDLREAPAASVLGKRAAQENEEGPKRPRLDTSSPTEPKITAAAYDALTAQVQSLKEQLATAQAELETAKQCTESADVRAKEASEKATQSSQAAAELEEKAQQLEASKKALALLEGKAAAGQAALDEVKEELEKLKSAAPASSAVDSEKLRAEAACAICRDLMLTPYSLRCGCSFCEVCLHTSLRSSLKCPHCAAAIVALPTKCRALGNIAQLIAPAELEAREKKIKQAMETGLKTLNMHLSNAKKKGCTFLDVEGRDWNADEVAKFDSGIRIYHGPCKHAYLEVIGVTRERLAQLSPAAIVRVATNLGIRSQQWQLAMLTSTATVRSSGSALAQKELLELYDSPFFLTRRIVSLLS